MNAEKLSKKRGPGRPRMFKTRAEKARAAYSRKRDQGLVRVNVWLTTEQHAEVLNRARDLDLNLSQFTAASISRACHANG